MVTIRSSSSDVISPALVLVKRDLPFVCLLFIPLVQVDIGFLADQVGVAASDTLDLGQGVHDLLFSIDVGVEETKNKLEVRLLSADESCRHPLADVRVKH